MPFDDAAEAKCADSESEDEYVESRLMRVLREEAGEAKPEAPRYTQLDDELLSDMQRGDEQMRRLVRHRLNKQREAADEKVCRQLLRKERFERGMRKGCIDNDEKLAALAQREEVEEVRAEAKQREDDEREARRLAKLLRDEAYAEYVEERLRDEEARAAQAADAKGARAAKEMAQRLARAAFVDRKRREAGPADASKCWAAAMANCEVEDVADAVGLSIRLPALTDVRVAHRNRLVTITAKRGGALQALTNDRAKDRGPRSLAMKFELVSPEDARDVSYEYDCGSGYLHVFLDGIKLGKMSDSQKKRTLASIRGRLAAAASSKLSALKKAVGGGGPDLSLRGVVA